MNELKFIDKIEDYEDAFIAYISKSINSHDSLMWEYYYKLNLPEYFGLNWNALDECLTDFHWINEKGIVIVHDDIPGLDIGNLTIYVDVLVSAIDIWKKRNGHYLDVIFPKKYEADVMNLIKSERM